MSAPTQNGRVLAALRHRGTRGITRNDFEAPRGEPVIDGGDRILRLARCIGDLEAQGYTIARPEKRDGVQVYVLVGAPSADLPDTVPGWTREWQCYAPTSPGRECMAHLHGPIGETCPRGHRSVLAWVLDTRRLQSQESPRRDAA